MKIYLKEILIITSVLFFLGASGLAVSASENEESQNLTDVELQELNQAKKDTQYFLNNPDAIKVETNSKDVKADEEPISAQSSGVVGSVGDVLVTLDGTSSGSSSWAGGHAGIVYSSQVVLESFGNKGAQNGVRYWPNDWGTRYNDVTGVRPKGSPSRADYVNAKNYANAQELEPYNYNFFNKDVTYRWYCSQLAYKAWDEQGYDIDDGGLAVWPVDLIQSNNTYVFYTQ
ncbi:hypothetical protein [Gracilibacillus massiliensis]|uniref:hypothetical protein n=1 Tax=Gracilibacillus massiliensis TaxID=1564956 RepID=UPI00071CDFF5|nr:hypothetical protein [Gracilibacillus massiliensis]